MPELPEVETTRRGISPHLLDRLVTGVTIRDSRLRWPVPEEIVAELPGQVIHYVRRRAKYLLIGAPNGTAILHLGMSGSLRVLKRAVPPGKHDHVDIMLDSDRYLRFNDPRRFGCLLWTRGDPLEHPLLSKLGPEPLGKEFDGEYLFRRSRGRRVSIKQFLMDSATLVGVGNIYASEALFRAGIHPGRQAGRVARPRMELLAESVKEVLEDAIRAGGTTLRDFTTSDGSPGYFSQKLCVYGRAGEPCTVCGGAIMHKVLGQRSTYYCKSCQR